MKNYIYGVDFAKPCIYGVDFDGTLCESKWPDIGAPNLLLIDFLKRRRDAGDQVILVTMREGMKLDEALKWCSSFGLIFDAVNDNLPQIKGFFGGNPRKIFCNAYIDDTNVDKAIWKLPYRE